MTRREHNLVTHELKVLQSASINETLTVGGAPIVPNPILAQARNIFYVSSAIGSDNYDGRKPTEPFATIQAAVDAVTYAGDVILVAPGNYAESVETPNYTTGPNYVHLIGTGSNQHTPYWESGGATEPCLIVKAVGWHISGFRFACPTTAFGVVLTCTQPPYTADDIAIRTVIENCHFYGGTTGYGGIDLHGAPYECQILNNMFSFLHQAGSTAVAIGCTDSGYANAYRTIISGNIFEENDNHISMNPRGLNVSQVIHNHFHDNGAYAATLKIDLRGGTIGYNLVGWNTLGGTYSKVGGYYAGTGDNWNGNAASTGFTAAVPA